jgi:hypothetical protein
VRTPLCGQRAIVCCLIGSAPSHPFPLPSPLAYRSTFHAFRNYSAVIVNRTVAFVTQHAQELWPGVGEAALRELALVACVLGQSRLWADKFEAQPGYAVFVPLADMLNHRMGESPVNADRACPPPPGINGQLTPCRVLRAAHDVAEGEELYDSYDKPEAFRGNTLLINSCTCAATALAWRPLPRWRGLLPSAD